MTIKIKGKVWKFGDNISTDLIMPGSVMGRPGISDEEATQYCMNANRPGWAAEVQKGDIVVAGRNWGCGSSRPAPRLLKTLGISIIVAESMSRLFFRNSVNIALPVLICSGISQAFEEGDQAEVNMDTGEVANLTKQTILRGEPLPADSPPMQILRAGGLDSLLRERLAEGSPPC